MVARAGAAAGMGGEGVVAWQPVAAGCGGEGCPWRWEWSFVPWWPTGGCRDGGMAVGWQSVAAGVGSSVSWWPTEGPTVGRPWCGAAIFAYSTK
nr:hypothetical protein [Tanacetum cinerariifolium]